MKQIITKNGLKMCTTSVPYDDETIKQMKKAGYRVKTIDDDKPATKTSKGEAKRGKSRISE